MTYFIGTLFTSSSCDDFFEKDISEKTVQVISPTNDIELSGNRATFVWELEEGAETYHVVIVSPSFDYIQKYVCDSVLTENRMSLELPSGEYQWFIQAENFGYKSLRNYLNFKIINNEK